MAGVSPRQRRQRYGIGGSAGSLLRQLAARLASRPRLNWDNQGADLKEDLAHLVQDIKRRIYGIASAGEPSKSAWLKFKINSCIVFTSIRNGFRRANRGNSAHGGL
jgi:hypothetical protein